MLRICPDPTVTDVTHVVPPADADIGTAETQLANASAVAAAKKIFLFTARLQDGAEIVRTAEAIGC